MARGDNLEGESDLRILEHKDTTISMTKKGSKKIATTNISYKGKWRIYFDGGSRKGIATGGYLIFDH